MLSQHPSHVREPPVGLAPRGEELWQPIVRTAPTKWPSLSYVATGTGAGSAVVRTTQAPCMAARNLAETIIMRQFFAVFDDQMKAARHWAGKAGVDRFYPLVKL